MKIQDGREGTSSERPKDAYSDVYVIEPGWTDGQNKLDLLVHDL